MIVLTAKVPTPSPLLTSYFLEVKGVLGTVNIGLNRPGFHEALTKHYLAVDYVRDNCFLNNQRQRGCPFERRTDTGQPSNGLKVITSELPESFDNLVLP
ncbi:hypothetical protein [Pseudozobellia thermophila]|uniref:Uncharacterized protein n=1 Tax=Pseudozobellia thermophila TaxID=192903 RepID=A0A1M6GA25_9FLAO|nr:hypothetical protein [Pseudozobellia thermophila]SHJ06803.1 hypothetical protein SAMN04488513_102735 [Pseudozobellia thermophila]